jgi:hypothetical protein
MTLPRIITKDEYPADAIFRCDVCDEVIQVGITFFDFDLVMCEGCLRAGLSLLDGKQPSGKAIKRALA